MTAFIAPSDVVAFWKEAGPDKWFAKDEAFDAEFRARGHDLHWSAARREHNDWIDTPESALALLILLDQYPRNSFRGTAHQFATDPLALMFANQAVARDLHLAVEPELKNFLLLPFEHSERIEDQDRYMALVAGDEELEKWGRLHRDIIVRFGEQQCWRLKPVNQAAALKLGWNAGNLHWRVRFEGDVLVVLLDAPLETYRARIRPLLEAGEVVESDAV